MTTLRRWQLRWQHTDAASRESRTSISWHAFWGCSTRKMQLCLYVCMVITYGRSKDQPGRVVNPARGQLEQGKCLFPYPRSRLRIWSREKASAVPSRVSLLISILRLNLVLTYGISFSRVPRRRPFYLFKPPCAIGSVPSLSGHAIAYRWRSLPRVRRHRGS